MGSGTVSAMNRLPNEKRIQILHMLVEGSSMRSVSRIAGVSINTVTKLLVDAGTVCQAFHDANVEGLKPKRVQCDEIWSFCYAKGKNVKTAKAAPARAGDVWTWTALDSDSKLMISWLVGARDLEYAKAFMQDVARRIKSHCQLTTDGFTAYYDAVDDAFGANVDYAQLVKLYGKPPFSRQTEARYSPVQCVGARKEKRWGNPDEKHISTSHVERSNLSIRMHNRRFTRLTNAFSKKLENHCHSLAVYFFYYNFIRIHSSIRVTPAMEAGLAQRVWEWDDVIELMDDPYSPKWNLYEVNPN